MLGFKIGNLYDHSEKILQNPILGNTFTHSVITITTNQFVIKTRINLAIRFNHRLKCHMLVIADSMSDIVGQWDVSLSNGVHHIEFEHGTTSGKRIIRIDGKVCVTFDTSAFVPWRTLSLQTRELFQCVIVWRG